MFLTISEGKRSPPWSVKDEHIDKSASLLTDPTENSSSGNPKTIENQCSDCLEVPSEEPSIESVSAINSPILPTINNHPMSHKDSPDKHQSGNNNSTP
ncbi:hypothetical protein O181_123502 [Austropuccinia psidii MF-1]|uniref:Uncharacterized protein n=1 Tax=Austropuccinia psidii MF-1 TaxID=1389203 RepID=A0A9Q3KQ63_9BASI|nr:hypothetical protein [Austropuccinia psidii MF-1]